MFAQAPTKTKPVYSYMSICEAMRTGRKVSITARSNGRVFHGMIVNLQKEDGSGNNWIVTICEGLQYFKVFVVAK